MKYYRYKALLLDGERIEDVVALIGVPGRFVIRFGLIWVGERVALFLHKRVQFDVMLEHHMLEIPSADLSDFTEQPWIMADTWREAQP